MRSPSSPRRPRNMKPNMNYEARVFSSESFPVLMLGAETSSRRGQEVTGLPRHLSAVSLALFDSPAESGVVIFSRWRLRHDSTFCQEITKPGLNHAAKIQPFSFSCSEVNLVKQNISI